MTAQEELFECKNCHRAFSESDSHERFEEFCSTECEADYNMSQAEYYGEKMR